MDSRLPGIAVIGEQSDTLCRSLVQSLRGEQLPVRCWHPGELSNLSVSLGQELLLIDGQAVAGVFFRATPERRFSADYIARDQGFCDAETRALWLTGLNLDSVLAINRYDASAWFEGFGWSTWRRRLRHAGIPLASMHIGGHDRAGAHWHLFGSGEQRPLPSLEVQKCLAAATTESAYERVYLAVDGTLLNEKGSPIARAAAAALKEQGIWLAELHFDQHETLLGVNPLPRVEDPLSIQQISRKATGAFHEHLDRWRHRRPDRNLRGLARPQTRLAGA